MVTLVVGSTKTLTFHKNLLASSSKVFDRTFNGSFQEATSDRAEPPEDHPESVALFFGWPYSGNIEYSKQPLGPSSSTCQLIHLFCFEEKYDIVALKDATMDAFLLVQTIENLLPRVFHYQLTYSNT